MVNINIDSTTYVNDHYEITYTDIDTSIQYNTQFYAKEMMQVTELLDYITNAYIMKNTGINFTNISVIPIPDEVIPLTQAELDKQSQQVIVDSLKVEKDVLSKDLQIAYDRAIQLNASEVYMSLTNFSDAKTNLQTYIDDRVPGYIAKYNEYKTALDALKLM